MKNAILYLSLFSLLAGCSTWNTKTLTRKTHTDLESAVLTKRANLEYDVTLQGYYADGASVAFETGWKVEGDSNIIGLMCEYDSKGKLTKDFKKVDFHIEGIELWRTSRNLGPNERALFGGTWFLVAADVGLGIICLNDPKTCFGSCPTFYQGESDHLFNSDAEGFTNAILPSLEHEDIDALPHIMHPGEEQIVMKNEALETHNINEVKLLSVPQIAGTEVFHTPSDQFFRVQQGPALTAEHRGDTISEVLTRDGNEWFELANENDLAAKSALELSFDADPAKSYGLQVVYRQTLMSTFLFYGTLENMGGDYGRRMAIMNHSEHQKNWLLKGGIMQFLGPIEVLNSSNKSLGAFEETGPIAHNSQLLPLGKSDGEITLRLTQGLWRIDHIRIVEIIEEVEPQIHAVQTVIKNDITRPEEAHLLTDPKEYLQSLPGEERSLKFEPLTAPSHVFLASKGYYLEWSRTGWDYEGNPRALSKMLLQPRQYLRDEAAAFKVYESEMEPKFWASKIQQPILTSHEK